MTVRTLSTRGLRLATRAVQHPAATARAVPAVASLRARGLVRAAGRDPEPGTGRSPRESLRENGFAVLRGLLPAEECAQLAARFKEAAGIKAGEEFTRTDAMNKVPVTQAVLFDDRVLTAVRSVLDAPVRFLQVSDLHYRHDTAGWHRDSVHRAADNSTSADWSRAVAPYQIVKAILYLESDNAAMGMMAGSHLSPAQIDYAAVLAAERLGAQRVIGATDDPHLALSDAQRLVPLAWRSLPGDLLLFDQRMYHAGRRVEQGRVTDRTDSAKLTLSLVFGTDNMHSERFYSYFRYARRELGYRPYPPAFERALKDRGLLLGTGTNNYYRRHPEELRLAHLRRPQDMDSLIAEFTRS